MSIDSQSAIGRVLLNKRLCRKLAITAASAYPVSSATISPCHVRTSRRRSWSSSSGF